MAGRGPVFVLATLGLLSPHSGVQCHHLYRMSLGPDKCSIQLMPHGLCLDVSQVAAETLWTAMGGRPGIPSLGTVTLISTLVTLIPNRTQDAPGGGLDVREACSLP